MARSLDLVEFEPVGVTANKTSMLVFDFPGDWYALHFQASFVEVADCVGEGDYVIPITTENENFQSCLEQLGNGEITAFRV